MGTVNEEEQRSDACPVDVYPSQTVSMLLPDLAHWQKWKQLSDCRVRSLSTALAQQPHARLAVNSCKILPFDDLGWAD